MSLYNIAFEFIEFILTIHTVSRLSFCSLFNCAVRNSNKWKNIEIIVIRDLIRRRPVADDSVKNTAGRTTTTDAIGIIRSPDGYGNETADGNITTIDDFIVKTL